MWALTEDTLTVEGAQIVHVYPIDDLRPHSCGWCQPRLELYSPLSLLVIHQSADGREAYETGLRLPA